MKRILMLAILAIFCVMPITGCGGGEDALGVNSTVEVYAETDTVADMADIDVITSPQEGWYDAWDACSYYATGFGCNRESVGSRYLSYGFSTQSVASSRPYYLWVVNNSSRYINVYLEVKMDGTVKRYGNVRIAPNTASHQMNIYRNNADWF